MTFININEIPERKPSEFKKLLLSIPPQKAMELQINKNTAISSLRYYHTKNQLKNYKIIIRNNKIYAINFGDSQNEH